MDVATHRQLSMSNPRVFEDFRLSQSSVERIKEITVVESAYDSVLCRDFTYVSTPITSGEILYKALDDAGLSDLEELKRDKAFFYNNVILPNITAASDVADTMLNLGGAVIAPALFEAKSLDWGQDEYMGLWLDTIERKATRLAMVDGWQYSNGGCEEYLQALLMQAGRRDRNNIAIVTASGSILHHHRAMQLMLDAVVNLLHRNFIPSTIVRVLYRCLILHAMVGSENDYGILTDKSGKQSFKVNESYYSAHTDKEQLREVHLGIRDLLTSHPHLVTKADMDITSSIDLSPGLIRQTQRSELSECRAQAQRKDI